MCELDSSAGESSELESLVHIVPDEGENEDSVAADESHIGRDEHVYAATVFEYCCDISDNTQEFEAIIDDECEVHGVQASEVAEEAEPLEQCNDCADLVEVGSNIFRFLVCRTEGRCWRLAPLARLLLCRARPSS